MSREQSKRRNLIRQLNTYLGYSQSISWARSFRVKSQTLQTFYNECQPFFDFWGELKNKKFYL